MVPGPDNIMAKAIEISFLRLGILMQTENFGNSGNYFVVCSLLLPKQINIFLSKSQEQKC